MIGKPKLVLVENVPENPLILHVMNGFMAVEDSNGNGISTYPDVITVFSLETGLPISVGN